MYTRYKMASPIRLIKTFIFGEYFPFYIISLSLGKYQCIVTDFDVNIEIILMLNDLLE